MTRIKIHISNVKLPFYPPYEVKCGLQNRVSTSMSLFSVVMAVEILVVLRRVSSYFVWPFEELFFFNLLQNLPDQLSKHYINHLGIGRP